MKKPLGFMIRRIGTEEYSDGRDHPTVGKRTRRKVWKTKNALLGHITRVTNMLERHKRMYSHITGNAPTISDFYGDCEIVELRVAKRIDLTEELFLRNI